ncbi:MAG: putative alpha/beta-fold hydrolase [Paracoccaceae bacterium]|jgi:predicted alpha/beta-fold hydrolase
MSSKSPNTIDYHPPFGLRNTHVQTILSSVGPRKALVAKRFTAYANAQQKWLLDGGDGVRLEGYFNQAVKRQSQQLIILIHGWEGSHNSSYMKSMAMLLLENGIDVFRLNLRDHGDTHQLNKGIFNSTMIDEVTNAVEDLQSKLVYSKYHLAGFSLGGNFSLRLAATAHDRNISLSTVSAFCPAIHAAQSNVALNLRSNWLYGRYFVHKWKRSLRKKIEHWPDYDFGPQMESLKTLDQLNDAFIPKYTGFSNVDDYFDAYAISGSVLDSTIAPCYLHFAEDDRIIPVEGVDQLSKNPNIHIKVTKFGGHCGYMSNWRGESWQDQRILEIIQQS